ncbi:MAG: YciI family protein [Methanomicrobiales archaeon]|nr:YciI family protein [Methanomicrobiales archaeon]
MTREEKEVMEQHFTFTLRLFEQGKILLGGAAVDGSIGILVIRVDSSEEVRKIYENDPAVKAEIGYPERHPFRIGLFSHEFPVRR